MATHDYVIDNSTGANVRADINLVLQAILTNNSSSSAPSTTAAYMWWADTTNGVLKIRNSSNNDWVELLQLDGTLTLEDGSVSTPALAFRDDLDTGIFSSAANSFNIATAGVERIEFGTTECVVNDGGADVDFRVEGDTNANLFKVDAGNDRVGIGLASPTAPFHVYSAGSNTLATLESGDATARLQLKDNSGEVFVAAKGDALTFANTSSTTERMRIDSSGRLLIGITSARGNFGNNTSGVEQQIQLEGTSSITSSMSLIRNSNDANDGGFIVGKTRGTSVGSNTVVQAGDDLGNIAFAGADGTSMLFGAEIKATVESGVGNDDMPAALVFSTNGGSTSTSERMRINSDGTVAIGPNTDGHALLTLSQSASAHLNALAIQQGNTGSGSGDGLFIGIDSNADAFIFHKENRSIEFGTANTERMRIDSSGDIGLGTSSPNLSGFSSPVTSIGKSANPYSVLELQGNNTSDGAFAILVGYNSGGSARTAQINMNRDGANNSGSLSFETASNGTLAERMRITSGGSVRIGTTTALKSTELLTVHSNNSQGIAIGYGTGTNEQRRLYHHSTGLYFESTTNQAYLSAAGAWTDASDVAIKKDIEDITYGITTIKNLKPRKYKMKADDEAQIGFIAQEMEEQIPEVVGGKEGSRGISYGSITAVLTKALQEAIAKIEVLETKVAALEAA